MPELIPDYLVALHDQLLNSYSVDNEAGFITTFTAWVAQTWDQAEYFELKASSRDGATQEIAVATGQPLREVVTCYSEFLLSATGQPLPGFPAGPQSEPELMLDALHELWFQDGVNGIVEFSRMHNITLPASEISPDTPDLRHAILNGFADPVLNQLGQPILSLIGDAVHPDYLAGYKEAGKFHNGYFGHWSLSQFLQTARLYNRLSQPAPKPWLH